MPMLLDREYKIPSKYNSKISLKVVPGHFATSQSHINFYMDMTTLKVRHCDAAEVAKEMAERISVQHSRRHHRLYGRLRDHRFLSGRRADPQRDHVSEPPQQYVYHHTRVR